MLRLGSTEVRARFTFLGSQFKIQTSPDKFCLEKKAPESVVIGHFCDCIAILMALSVD